MCLLGQFDLDRLEVGGGGGLHGCKWLMVEATLKVKGDN